MAAGEDQAKPIILREDPSGLDPARAHGPQLVADRAEALAVTGIAPEAIDRAMPSGGEQPGARVARHAIAWPGFQRDDERLLDELFRDLPVAEHADQRRHKPASLFTDGLRQPRIDQRSRRRRGHGCRTLPQSCLTTGRISRAALDGHPETSSIASSRSATSMIA